MAYSLRAATGDDAEFVRVADHILSGMLDELKPQELYLVAIDNWFDHKWLGFSGKGIIDFEFPAYMNRYDGAIAEFRQDQLTIPPFSPGRVVSQQYFRRDHAGAYLEGKPRVPLHRKEREHSENNLHRRINAISGSGVFAWYSASTLVNAKASLLVSTVQGDRVETWYASFRRQKEWKLHLTKGIDRDRVQELLGRTDDDVLFRRMESSTEPSSSR